MLLTTELYDGSALALLTAAATALGSDLKAGLYVNSLTPNKMNVLADLTEPAYASYVRQAVVLGAPFRDPNNGIAAVGAGLLWQQTGTPTPVTIQGIFYTYGVTPLLLAIEPFPAPITLNDTLDAFVSVLEYIQSSQAQGFTTTIR